MEKETPKAPPRQRILEASFVAFNQKGYQSASMDAIAKELGMSKKTIYKHFGSKEELLEATLVVLFGRIEASLARVQKQSSLKAQLMPFFETLREWRRALSPLLRQEIAQELNHLHDRIETFERQTLLRYMISYLKDLRSEGLIDYPPPSREFALAFFQLMSSLTHSANDHAQYFLEGLMKGMISKKRKKGK